MARIKTFVNGGSLLPGDLNSIQDDYETAFSAYKHVHSVHGLTSNASGTFAAGTYVLDTGLPSLAIGADVALYLDPADLAAGSRTVKLRLKAALTVNNTAPATTLTFGLYPITAFVHTATGAVPIIDATSSLGTVVSGSTVAFASPSASSLNQATSSDFTHPAAGYYAVCLVNSGGSAANSVMSHRVTLQYRQV